MMPEHLQCTTVSRHCVIVEVAADNPAQPPPLFRDRLVHAPSHLLLYLLELRPHAVPSGFAVDLDFPCSGFATDEGEAQKVEGLRLAEPLPLAALCRKASELDQPGLLRMQRQRKLPQPLAHLLQKEPAIAMVLEPDDEVVGVAHNDHVAGGHAPSPACGPEVERVVQVDVGEQVVAARPRPRPPAPARNDPVFQDARLQPFLDQTDDAPIADPMFQETDQPLLANLIEERSDVGVQDEAHLVAVHPDTERIQRVMRATPWSESIREPEEVFLVDRVQQCDYRPLDNLVLEGCDPERTRPRLPPVGHVCPRGARRRADAPGHPAWECRLAETAVPDTLPVGPDHASPRYCVRGLPRRPSTSADPRRGLRSAQVRRTPPPRVRC